MRIIVSGVKGCGKTTITQLVKKKMPKVKVFNFGDYIKKAIKKKYPKLKRDEWDEKISLKEHKKFQIKAAKEIAKKAKNCKYVIIDTNLIFKKQAGFFPGLTEELLESFKPDVIAVMEFKPEDIIKRRKKDTKIKKTKKTKIGTISTTRKRKIETKKEIEFEQTLQREFLVDYAVMVGATIKIINLRFKESKPFEHAEIAADEIIKILKG